MLQEPRRLQEASGGIRRPQEAPGRTRIRKLQEAPGGPRMIRKLQGCSRKPQDVPECFRKPERSKSVVGVANISQNEKCVQCNV